MTSNANVIRKAIQELGFSPERFRHLSSQEADQVYDSARRRFVSSDNPRWWWEHFESSTSVHFESGDGWKHVGNIVPNPDERVWFIAEDDVEREFSVYEAAPPDIQAVLSECHAFEYYVIHKNFRWLVCENHHNFIIAVGEEVESRLRQREQG